MGQSSTTTNHSRDNGRSSGRNFNHGHHNNNQAFLATMLSEPAQSSSMQPQEPSSSTTTSSSTDPVAFLTTTDSTPIVNDDIQADFYDNPLGFAFAAMSTELSNALALISVSTGPKAALNTVLNSGSTHHIFRNRSVFCSYKAAQDLSIKTANCGSLMALGTGTVVIVISLAGRRIELVLPNCLHAPDVPINLFSVGDLQENGFRVHFEPGTLNPYTNTVFPSTHATLPNFCLQAEFINRLSFLSCDFRSTVAMPAVAPDTNRFPPISPTPSAAKVRFGPVF